MSQIKDPTLAPQGKKNLQIAENNMGALLHVRSHFQKQQPFKNLTIGLALHITKETGVLVRTLRDGGAKVAITGCNPLSTQDDVAASLAEEDNVEVYGYKGETDEDYYQYLRNVIEHKPDIVIDDGCDLVTEIHQNYSHMIPNMIGGCEETTTGIIRLQSMQKDGALHFPVIAVNDNKTKHLMDNYYGTGQSTLDGITRASNLLWSGKTVVVVGYGSCGKGIALRAKGLGSNVIVTEVDSFCALQAVMDGFRIMPIGEAVKHGDVFITVTGNKNVIDIHHMKAMKDRVILANSGHFDNEINMEALQKESSAKEEMRPLFDEYILDGKRIYICGEGRLVNLSCAEGHPSEVMSLSFCGQALACQYLVKHQKELGNGVHTLPVEIDTHIATLQLQAMGMSIDTLTDEQKEYLSSWQFGT